jgi:glycosyltransferase involved in cell wall biosynthesis
MGENNFVSVVMPAYNAERYVCEAIDSVLAQTHLDRELIVVDDGSSDGTAGLLERYGDAIRVIRQHNQGSGAACNAGVYAARGPWIALLDADDLWLPQKLELQLQASRGRAISYTDMTYFGESIGAEIRRSSFSPGRAGFVLEELLVENFIPKSSVLVLRDAFLESGGFPSKYYTVEDWPLWLSICAKHAVGYLNEPVLRYRVHPKSKSMAARKTMADHVRILDDAFKSGGVGAAHLELRRRALAMSFRINSNYAAQSGDWPFAFACAVRAICLEPWVRSAWKSALKTMAMPFGVPY